MIGRKIIIKDTLTSTNNYIANIVLNSKIEHGTVIMAESQSSGKGQRGTVWDSEPYKNLTLSIFLKHDKLAVQSQFFLNQCISLAIVRFLKKYSDSFAIKWPNDIVHQNSKIAGILIENSLEREFISNSIVGIGININQETFGEYKATSLKNVTNQEFNIQNLLYELIEELNLNMEDFYRNKLETIKSNYLKNLWLLNEKSLFQDSKGQFQGEITGVNEHGQLLVQRDGKEMIYNTKELVFLARN